jgi:hypothetical protein
MSARRIAGAMPVTQLLLANEMLDKHGFLVPQRKSNSDDWESF